MGVGEILLLHRKPWVSSLVSHTCNCLEIMAIELIWTQGHNQLSKMSYHLGKKMASEVKSALGKLAAVPSSREKGCDAKYPVSILSWQSQEEFWITVNLPDAVTL